MLLDIYGTNHDGRLWEYPNEFRPDQFTRSGRTTYLILFPKGEGTPLRVTDAPVRASPSRSLRQA